MLVRLGLLMPKRKPKVPERSIVSRMVVLMVYLFRIGSIAGFTTPSPSCPYSLLCHFLNSSPYFQHLDKTETAAPYIKPVMPINPNPFCVSSAHSRTVFPSA